MIPQFRPYLTAGDLLSLFRVNNATRGAFEAAVAAQSGAQYGLAFTYAHAGFLALLKARQLAQAEIIIPAYTCKIMAEVILATGNIPVFVDIDLADYTMHLDRLQAAITPKTRMIVATHMFGYPAAVAAIREMVADRDILVVEDAALMFPQAMRELGGLRGDIGLFSFGPAKPLFTIRGGVVVTNSQSLYEEIRTYRDTVMGDLPLKESGKRRILLAIHYLRAQSLIYDLSQRFNLSKENLAKLTARLQAQAAESAAPAFALPGDYDTRYANFQACIGLTQLHRSIRILAQHRALAKLYAQALCEIPDLLPAPCIEGASYALYTTRVPQREAIHFRQRLRAQGIDTGCTFNYALPDLALCRPYARGVYPKAAQASHEVVNLPMYVRLTAEKVHYIAENIRKILR